MAEGAALHVEVVSADHVVWSGEATLVVARTVEGDIGIMANHSPMFSVMVPNGVEIVSTDGERIVVAVDGGFVSVAGGRVSILSEYATLASELSLPDAEKRLQRAASAWSDADDSDEDARKEFERAEAEVKAARKAS
ncbi:F0F1 ATP synthase subunit epsilon [Naumannella halotolerans]|uniref:ATP synthase epsilon chain n=1 Tax=Naumannella halotolerans TaxID=993414 RepID=A0A4R7JB42_9ACTN|nr:F0F1 ATP synthase subunit epsilon [Naumannella halotolerans]TDT33639.1 F-type H+-transporting ATPase subunit epsilon [Naumannella halotolerans]